MCRTIVCPHYCSCKQEGRFRMITTPDELVCLGGGRNEYCLVHSHPPISELGVFMEFSCFLYDPVNAGNLISVPLAFSKYSLYIWKFSVHVLLKPSLKDFEHNLTSMGNECSCLVVWTFFGIALPWDWNENWPFPILWPLLTFPNLLAFSVQDFNSINF